MGDLRITSLAVLLVISLVSAQMPYVYETGGHKEKKKHDNLLSSGEVEYQEFMKGVEGARARLNAFNKDMDGYLHAKYGGYAAPTYPVYGKEKHHDEPKKDYGTTTYAPSTTTYAPAPAPPQKKEY
eukprot:TRINITY_DN20721_c0_g1_i1.p1 TRINITY_DN20721_c0_g1~~TRINITY_DN20721_c0_g1_i1.p1  ORF type:complete len:126 (-),score=26.41 TRINITY_DN20721_c0_g1_i1:72-449(-)